MLALARACHVLVRAIGRHSRGEAFQNLNWLIFKNLLALSIASRRVADRSSSHHDVVRACVAMRTGWCVRVNL